MLSHRDLSHNLFAQAIKSDSFGQTALCKREFTTLSASLRFLSWPHSVCPAMAFSARIVYFSRCIQSSRGRCVDDNVVGIRSSSHTSDILPAAYTFSFAGCDEYARIGCAIRKSHYLSFSWRLYDRAGP